MIWTMQLKDRIIHESLKLFSLKGFTGTRIDDILKLPGQSKVVSKTTSKLKMSTFSK